MRVDQLTASRAIRYGFCPQNILVLSKVLFFLVLMHFSFYSWAVNPELPPPYGLDNPQSIGKFLNGNLPSNTPTSSSGTVTSWKVVNAFPNINFVDPVDMREYPGQNRMVIAGKNGQVWTFQNSPNVSSRTLFLDISSRVRSEGDCGILGIIFHPQFGQGGSSNRGYFYVYYRYTQQKGRSDQLAYVRLSRFRVPDGQSTADPNSEYVMIQQYDRHDWHNGGSMFFGPSDGFLYVIMGDEGGARDEFNSSQKINKNFFGGIHRIDVDRRGGNISHPIRRQPQPPVNPPSGWPGTFSQGYYIPNDNPWVNSNGSIMEEFWALGFRSPHRMWLDPPTGDIWVGDIGQGAREEISIVHKGDNAQWPYKEGFRNGFTSRPGNLIGTDTPPLLDYDRSDGSSVIGGLVYRGSKWANSLGGKYIFSDNVVQNIWTVDYYNSGSNQKQLITTIPFETNVWKDGVSHIFTDQAGEVYILQLAGHNRSGGRIYKLAPNSQTSGGTNAPTRLSQTGAFTNLNSLTPRSGVIPYEPNVTFWSDGAKKRRWLALPNNGSHNTSGEKIQFSQNGEWTFPSGTVFIKHFDFPVDDRNPTITRKIETRFTVRGDNGQYYFLTYRWREDQSDADLVTSSQNRTLTIQTSSGTRQQVWHYPSNTECITCHNSSVRQVLGLNTRQLNGDMRYPSTGRIANQLETMNHLNWFTSTLNESQFPSFATVKPANHPSASLEDRARSYLDVNCGYCHRPGALQTSFDLRYTTSLANQGILNTNPGDNLGITGAKLIAPGDANKSVIYQRLISLHEGVMMPPLAKNKVDEEGKQLIRDWINGMGGSTDTQAPTVPSNLSASNITPTSFTLTWNSSSDNVGVAGYQIYQNG
ncbi:MAG: PQQ-dependent sugar dehydrogenase, partial [Bacteroidota bacterium]